VRVGCHAVSAWSSREPHTRCWLHRLALVCLCVCVCGACVRRVNSHIADWVLENIGSRPVEVTSADGVASLVEANRVLVAGVFADPTAAEAQVRCRALLCAPLRVPWCVPGGCGRLNRVVSCAVCVVSVWRAQAFRSSATGIQKAAAAFATSAELFSSVRGAIRDEASVVGCAHTCFVGRRVSNTPWSECVSSCLQFGDVNQGSVYVLKTVDDVTTMTVFEGDASVRSDLRSVRSRMPPCVLFRPAFMVTTAPHVTCVLCVHTVCGRVCGQGTLRDLWDLWGSKKVARVVSEKRLTVDLAWLVQYTPEYGVLVLNDENLDEAIEEFGTLLIAFYAPVRMSRTLVGGAVEIATLSDGDTPRASFLLLHCV